MNFLIHIVLASIADLIAAIGFRIRGGGWFQFNGNIIPRLIWGLTFALCYFLHVGSDASISFAASLVATAFLSMMVPHAYCQNMGRWASPQNRWPSFWLPDITQEDWTAMPMWERTLHDAMAMASVAFWRGLMVFTPYILIGYYLDGDALNHVLFRALLALIAVIIMQPLAYVVGWVFPETVTSSLPARTNMWGEFFTGTVWGFAVGFCW